MSIDFDEKVRLFKEFQNKWNLERLKSMTLEEYTSTMSDSNRKRDDFTFWIESRLDEMGSIWGGSSFKFGIYRQKNNESKESGNNRYYDERYGWFRKYGDSAEEAFKNIKKLIIEVVVLSKNNNLEAIEEIDLGDAFKWKIAFHYQNISDIKIINIFNKRWLEKIVGEEFGETDLKTYQMYQRILWDKKYSLVDILQKAEDCLKKYDFKDKKKKIAKGEDEKMQQDKNNTPLNQVNQVNQVNQILYGPPATGKTYNTIDRALEILASYDEGLKLPSQEDRKARKELFDKYRQKGQIEFVTFHQSYGYEEFVEGIKPKTDDNGNVVYEVEKGIFKKISLKALDNLESTKEETNNKNFVDELIMYFGDFIKQNYIDKGMEYPLDNEVTIKDILLSSDEEYQSFLLGGSIKSSQSLASKVIKRDFGDFMQGKIKEYKDVKPSFDSKRNWHGNAIYYFMLYRKLREFVKDNNFLNKKKENLKPYILIIDEINRGNISKIFGELITLIEPSKRIGKSEELRVRLPYSQEEFGVPCNLYIIGTMNTADRSITSIDTALRRRFEFVEMMPDSNKLKNLRVYKDNKDTGIELCDMLEKINKRIEFLYDREKTIGHAFFLSGCKEGEDSITLEKLKDIFQNKIIPLLQEYFYNDYALIQVVLNDNGMIIREEQELNDLFGSQALIDELDLEVKKMYSIASDENVWNSENTYIKIYQTSQKND